MPVADDLLLTVKYSREQMRGPIKLQCPQGKQAGNIRNVIECGCGTTLERWLTIPQVNEHLVTEIQQQADQDHIVDNHDDLAHQAMRQQPDSQARNQREDHDRRHDRTGMMDQQLDRLEIDPVFNAEIDRRS